MAAGFALFAQGALAELPFKAGDRELTFEGSLREASVEARLEFDGGGSLAVSDDETRSLLTTGTFGYFLTDRHEVGVIAGVLWFDSDQGSDFDALAGLSYDFHWAKEGSAIVPVAGALVRTVMFDAIADYTYGVSGGFRVLAAHDISVNARLYYEYTRAEDAAFPGAELIVEQDDVGVRLGFSWMLR
ncbi:MAG: hypothetical protein ACRETF_04035 [Nevskiaceae bacterium]